MSYSDIRNFQQAWNIIDVNRKVGYSVSLFSHQTFVSNDFAHLPPYPPRVWSKRITSAFSFALSQETE